MGPDGWAIQIGLFAKKFKRMGVKGGDVMAMGYCGPGLRSKVV